MRRQSTGSYFGIELKKYLFERNLIISSEEFFVVKKQNVCPMQVPYLFLPRPWYPPKYAANYIYGYYIL